MKFWEAMKALQDGYKIKVNDPPDLPTGYCYYKLNTAKDQGPFDPLVKVMVDKGGQVGTEQPLSMDHYAYLMMGIHLDWEVIY